MRAKIVVGLGYGDEGKGMVTSHLVENSYDPIVVRFSGGQQAGHTVHYKGIKHTCSNYGAGVLQGIPTYFTEHTTFYPVTIAREKEVLEKKGVQDPLLLFHPLAKMTTPWDVFENRACTENMAHGSCGLGIGKTMKRSVDNITIYAVDLLNIETLSHKLEQIDKYYEPIEVSEAFDKELIAFNKALLDLNWKIAPYSHLKEHSTVIFEGSQGVLLDMDHGVFPHVTYSNTTSKKAIEVCRKIGIDDISVYGVTRAYSTRHGNGPYITEGIELLDTQHETNVTNVNQGDFKVAPLDYGKLNYGIAIETIYSDDLFFTLMVTCCNQVQEKEEFDLSKLDSTVIARCYTSHSIYGEFNRIF